MKNVLLILIFACLSFGLAAQGARSDSQGIQFLEDQGFTVNQVQNFIFGHQVVEDKIRVYMNAPTTGWVSVGFNPSRRMRDANIIIGYVQNGQAFIRDDYGISDTSHASDVSQGGTDNVTLIEFGEDAGRTYFIFEIPLDSGDQFDRPLIVGNSYPVIWAYAPNNQNNFTAPHTRRGSFTIGL